MLMNVKGQIPQTVLWLFSCQNPNVSAILELAHDRNIHFYPMLVFNKSMPITSTKIFFLYKYH